MPEAYALDHQGIHDSAHASTWELSAEVISWDAREVIDD